MRSELGIATANLASAEEARDRYREKLGAAEVAVDRAKSESVRVMERTHSGSGSGTDGHTTGSQAKDERDGKSSLSPAPVSPHPHPLHPPSHLPRRTSSLGHADVFLTHLFFVADRKYQQPHTQWPYRARGERLGLADVGGESGGAAQDSVGAEFGIAE